MNVPVVLRYAMVSVINTLVGYTCILVLQIGLGWRPIVANFGGYSVGFVISYMLNHRFTFASKQSHRRGLPLFAAAVATCYALNVVVLIVAADLLLLPPALAQALAVVAYGVALYVLSRRLVFGPERGEEPRTVKP
jgi:putative flippase GtrA